MFRDVTTRVTTSDNLPTNPAQPGPPERTVTGYPDDLVADVLMGFGFACVRPMRRDDADALVALHERLSRQSQ
jgi:hypothetical protein